MKNKPEYSSEYDQPLNCVIIGRSYGSGKNSGKLTRYPCGILEGGETPASFVSLLSVRSRRAPEEDSEHMDYGNGARYHR